MLPHRQGLKLLGCAAHQVEIKNLGRFRPGSRNIARRIPNKRDSLPPNRPPLLFNGKDITQNLTRMLVIRQRVDRGNFGKLGKLLHIPLGKGPNHRPMHHSAHHPSRIPDQLPPPQLNFGRTQKAGHPAQLPNRHLKRNPCPRRSFRKNQSPNLSGQRTLG